MEKPAKYSFPRRLNRIWMDSPLRFKGMVVISIPLLCILLCVVSIHMLQKQRSNLSDWISRAFRIGSSIQLMITSHTDAGSGVRSYLLTGGKEFLAPLEQLRRDLPQRLDRLQSGLEDSPEQSARLDGVGELAQRRISVLTSLAEQYGKDASAGLAEDRRLRAEMDRALAEMRSHEAELWIARIGAETAIRRRLMMATYVSALIAFFGGSLAIVLFVTGIARRLELIRINAYRVVEGEALLAMPTEGDEIGQLGKAIAQSGRMLMTREQELRNLNQNLDAMVRERTAQLAEEAGQRRAAEEKLHQVQKMEAIGQLAGGIAHDFNNLLTVINGYAHMLKGALRENDPAVKTADLILSAGNRAAQMTAQLLAFSRRQVLDPRVIDVNDCITQLEPMLRRLIQEDREIVLVLEKDLDLARVDPSQLEQVILNLAINARDAMPRGGQLTIETNRAYLDESYCSTRLDVTPGPYVLLSIADNGVGIPPEHLPRIFDPFFTTKEVGEGTGLGLSTVHGIVKQSGGHISVYSELGVGTTFKVYLPVATGATTATDSPIRATEAVRGNETVLVAEDDPGVREFIADSLLQHGYTVIEASSGAEAILALERHNGPVHVLVTDVIMPKLNGRHLAEFLSLKRPELKVLYISGYTENAIVHQGVLDPGVHFLAKPFSPMQLVEKLRVVLETPNRIKSVAVIDDEEAIRNLIQQSLEEAGYEVRGFGIGSEALDDLRRSPVNLIITDLFLPEQAGTEIGCATWM